MSSRVPPSDKAALPRLARRRRWLFILGGLFILLLIFSGIGFVTATALEDQDNFCISCHTVPEVTYYNRGYISLDHPDQPVTDLATAHYHLSQQEGKIPFACIDCHRGDAGLPDRVAAIALGARDSLIYVTGHEDPTIEKTQTAEGWLSNDSCIGCHASTLLNVTGFNNHYHTKLMQAAALRASGAQIAIGGDLSTLPNVNQAVADWTKTVNVTLDCTACHIAHKTVPNGTATQFVDTHIEAEACVICHKAAQQGPQDASELQN